METLQVRFVPIQVKSILDQYFENWVISKYEIDKFYEEVTKFYETITSYL